MGQKLSSLAPSAPTVAISSYVDALGYQYVEILSNSRFLRTVKAIDENGQMVIIKILIKPTTTNIQLKEIIDLSVKQSTILQPFNNILTWSKFIETDRAGNMIRQMLKTNLYDRLSIRPFLEPIEKLFIIYQIIKIVNQLHSLNIHHGDLRLENFLVNSWNWIYLCDFANIIKPVYIPEDNPNQFLFYFDSSDRRVCYIAPERFYKSKDYNESLDDEIRSVTDSMDLFSLGCVIAEIYSDGEAPFTLSQLFKFIKNDYKPQFKFDPLVISVVEKLIKLNPSERASAREILNEDLFPQHFTWLYTFIQGFNTQKDSDTRLKYIYNNFGEIGQRLNFRYEQDSDSGSGQLGSLPMKLNLPTMSHDYQIKPNKQQNQSAIIILHSITSLLNSLKHVSSKVYSCELIVALSEYIPDESKLDRAIPYLCSFLDDEVTQVVCAALYSITSVLLTTSRISPINVSFFPEYLLPKLSNVKQNSQINSCVATCLPYLSIVAKKFWILSKSFSTMELTKDHLDAKFKDIVLSLLTDGTDVKISLLQNILPLCQYFGQSKTNDIILPHLISYLNDSDTQLKLAFLSSILEIGEFIGPISFETYLLPLLIQSLNGSEQFITLKVLQIFIKFTDNKIIRSLELYQELVNSATRLLNNNKTNEWIRQAVINLILTICDNLSTADKFCFLYPLIKKHLTYDIVEFKWETLYPCLR